MRIDKTKISILMAEQDLTQAQFAEKAGMSRGNLSGIINGKGIQARTALKIARALKVNINEILETNN